MAVKRGQRKELSQQEQAQKALEKTLGIKGHLQHTDFGRGVYGYTCFAYNEKGKAICEIIIKRNKGSWKVTAKVVEWAEEAIVNSDLSEPYRT